MKTILTLIIFAVVLFLYLHIYYYIKNSNDLEVYTIDNPSKDGLEEICNLRQPVAFKFENENLLETCNIGSFETNYGPFDIKIRNTKNNDDTSLFHVPLILSESIIVFEKDENNCMITENNSDFLEETGASKHFSYNDSFLRPPLVSNCIYDFYSGSIGSSTPLRYELNYRNFFYVTSGNISVKLICPKYSKYLYLDKDYENLEFRSPFNVWDIQDNYKYDFAKVKVLDIELKRGDIIFIPAYWWYSIRFNRISSVCVFKYRTFMNNVAIFPHIFTSFLQNQNIKNDIVKKFENTVVNGYDIINDIKKKHEEEDDQTTDIDNFLKPAETKEKAGENLSHLDNLINDFKSKKNKNKSKNKGDTPDETGGEQLEGRELVGTYY